MNVVRPDQFDREALEPWRYILSAGRTGTVFLQQLFANYGSDITAEHEPSPTRYQMMLGNLRNDLGVFDRTTKAWVHRTRRRRANQTPNPYVEINPFLCAVTDALPDPERPLRIVHIVRAPGDWAQSMTVFKASSKYRAIIDYVPFAKPFPAPRPEGWNQLSQFDKNLWRWVWCNDRILALKAQSDRFETIRYEDLFHADAAHRLIAVHKIFATLGLTPPEQIDWTLFERRVNPAPASDLEFNQDALERITGQLAKRLGYGQ